MTKDSVLCATCKREYVNAFNVESNQAYGCASDLVEKDGKMISYSHYGSKFDLMKYSYINKEGFNYGNICDECIEKAIKNEVAIEDKMFSYFG
jgi:UDP-N-acetylmuramyl tripeptide synthase